MSIKKKLLLGGIAVIALLLAGGALCGNVFAMPATELFESYSTGVDGNYTIQSNEWYAQTFTITPGSHSINEIRVYGYREGDPGTVTLSIRDTASGLPTGADLTSGTFNGDTVTNVTGAWCAVAVTEINLNYDEVYAVVMRAEAGDSTNSFHIVIDGSSGNYTGGYVVTSDNSGVTWTADTDDDSYFQIYGKALLEVIGAKVFQGYTEAGDILIVAEYLNTYTPYYPNEEAPYYFWIQLRNSTGSTILAQTTCMAWGLKPGSIYINPDEASGLTVGGTYRVYLVGNFGEAPTAYYTITSSDWYGTNLNLLDSWVITTAHVLGDYYETELTSTSGTTEILNEQGGVTFSLGIDNLEVIRPGLFSVSTYTPGWDEVPPDDTYEESTTWQVVVGPQVTAFLDAAGEIIGLEDGRWIGAGCLAALYFGLCLLIVARKGEVLIGAAMGIPILVIGSWLHLIDIVFVLVIVIIGAFFTMYRLWWART